MSVNSTEIQELEYTDYEARQRYEITEAGMRERMPKLGIGGRAKWIDGAWQAQPYPGYAFQAMVKPYAENTDTYPRLTQIRDELCEPFSADAEPALFPLPEDSFHQTVVSTFSSSRLETHVISKGIEKQFPEILGKYLAQSHEEPDMAPVKMRLIGVSLFRTAIGILGTFDDEAEFQRVVAIRDAAYENEALNEIGLTRTRPFIGHATLAYLERPLLDREKETLIERILKINEAIAADPFFFYMPEARLHRYDTLAEFIPDAFYPAFKI